MKVAGNTIEVSELRLKLARPLRGHEAPHLRQFFGRELETAILQHHHGAGGALIVQYPRVQFKILDSVALLLGVAEGSDLLRELFAGWDESDANEQAAEVIESRFETRSEQLGWTTEPLEYRFLTPWLGLNEKNFRSYTGSRNQKFRKDELSRILSGNCLGLAKSLGIELGGRISADGGKLTSVKTMQNGRGMIGFVGKFQINAMIPAYLGLGKSVARGFGTVSER